MADATTGDSGGERQRLVHTFGLLGARTLLVLAVLVAAVAVLHRLDWRLDWSADSRFSLSPELLAILDGLAADGEGVRVVSIWTDEPEHWGHYPEGELIAQRLARIAEAATGLRHRHIDSLLDQPALAAFEAEHGEVRSPALFVLAPGEPPFRIAASPILPNLLQRELGGALVTVTTRERLPLFVLQGHGELALAGDADDGVGALVHRLRQAGFTFEPDVHVVDEGFLASKPSIPHGGLLLVPGPTQPLGPAATSALGDYLRDGGAALFCYDHRAPGELHGLLWRWGVRMHFFAADDGRRVPSVLRSVRHSLDRGDNDLTRLQLSAERNVVLSVITAQAAARNQSLVSPRTVPLQYVDHPAQLAAWAEQDEPPAVATEVASWNTPPLDERAMPGDGVILQVPTASAWLAPADDRSVQPTGTDGKAYPIALALAYRPHVDSANPDTGARIALWASRQAASNRWVADGRYANAVLLGDLAAWLVDRGAATPIPTQQFARYQVDADEDGIFAILALLVVLLPCLCLGLAMLSWWERR